MINKMKIVLVVGIVIFGVYGTSFAMSCDMDSHKNSGQAPTQAVEKGSSATNVGNTVCPVTDDKVDGKTTYEYQDKIYNFCCPKCIPDFKNDPVKYIAKAEQSVSSEHPMQGGHNHGQ